MPQPTDSAIPDLILKQLRERGPLKAGEIAGALECDRALVNRLLYGLLAGKVVQDNSYRWTASSPSNAHQKDARASTGPLATLCRYYLDCLAHDAEQGCSVFAASNSGALNYAALSELPAFQAGGTWTAPMGEAAQELVQRTRRDRSAVLYVGYPVLMRYHRTAKWEGFFVEPLMIYTLEPGDNGVLRITDDLPSLNFKAIKSLGDGGNVLDDVVALAEELGLVDGEEPPTLEDIALRLQAVRPDWPWIDQPSIGDRKVKPKLAKLESAGIYNYAIVAVGERPNFTQGLENELKSLASMPDASIDGTALGCWASGNRGATAAKSTEPLVEVVGLNSEQRAAVESALTAPLTVITGPPGTGKSQVVTALLANCAWRGQRVLFASKNNKAVDVVDKRVNGLSSRPTLIRLGSKQYEARLAEFLVGLLSATVGPEDQTEYEAARDIQRRLGERWVRLQEAANELVTTRNQVDEHEAGVDAWREVFGPSLGHLTAVDRYALAPPLSMLEKVVRNADVRQAGVFRRLLWGFWRRRRLERVDRMINSPEVQAALKTLRVALPPNVVDDASIPTIASLVATSIERLNGLRVIQEYLGALARLEAMGTLEALAVQQAQSTEQLASNALDLWQSWTRLQPARLSKEDRKALTQYHTMLQVVLDCNRTGEKVPPNPWRQYRDLIPKIVHLIPCWAVTSLSAHGKIPFEPGFFDLLVIDEASQCDIASALPLLYRAKRVAVIGDPMQLTHISKLSPRQDAQVQQKQGLSADFTHWTYAVNSLFALATTQADGEAFVALRDHHRSHADIIEFSNRQFYDRRLRVATAYERLKRVELDKPAVRWLPVRGQVKRPAGGGAVNDLEAKAVVQFLKRLVVDRKYVGTVGVVSPFRAQSNRIRDLVNADNSLADALDRAEFIAETAHQFQGDERDVIVFSPVVSRDTPDGSIAFLRKNGNLFNVAITRARAALYVIGDKVAARESKVDYLAAFAKYTDDLQEHTDRVEASSLNRVLGPEYPTVARPELVSDWERQFYVALYAAGIRSIPQYPVEKYLLDFALIDGERRLNIEVDGERYHKAWDGELLRRDQLRNQRMIELGWNVKRFWVYQIRDQLEQCVEDVRKWLDGTEP